MSVFKIQTIRYFDKKGKRVKKKPDAIKKVEMSSKWYGQVKMKGKWKRHSLYKDKQSSEQRLAQLVKETERGEVGLTKENKLSLECPIQKHAEDFIKHLQDETRSKKHISERKRVLNSILNNCKIQTLNDLTSDKISNYLRELKKKRTKKQEADQDTPEEASAGTKTQHRRAIHAFAEWCLHTSPKRLTENPISSVPKPNGTPVRLRRAESEQNLKHLLKVASKRPLIEAQTVKINRGKKGKEGRTANLKPKSIKRFKMIGRERSLLYETAIKTGLRQSELRRLQVKDLNLESNNPSFSVQASHNYKNKTTIHLPLSKDHAKRLLDWIKDTQKNANDHVFYVPQAPNKILRRDLKAAGIVYKNDEKKYFDFHAFRYCTDTYLTKAGIPIAVIMLFMRHKTVKLSMLTYSDPKFQEIRKALPHLPKLH